MKTVPSIIVILPEFKPQSLGGTVFKSVFLSQFLGIYLKRLLKTVVKKKVLETGKNQHKPFPTEGHIMTFTSL